MKETLETIIKSLTEFPEQVSINEIDGEKSVVFEVKVAETDMGKVIGREGKIAAAISNGDIIKEPTFEEKLDEVLGIADKIEDALKSGDLDKKEKNYDRKGID